MTSAARLTEQYKCYSYRAEGGMPQKGNECSNKMGKKNRSVKVHGGEVKQSPFERQTKECGGGYGGTVDERKRERGRERQK